MNKTGATGYHVPQYFNSLPVTILTVAVLYAVVAQAGFLTTTLPGHIAPIFPSAGIALAAVILLGPRALWGVWLGSLAGNMISWFLGQPSSHPFFVEFFIEAFIAFGATAGAWAGAFLFRRFCGERYSLDRVQNILALIVAGALVATMVSPMVGVFSLAVAGSIPWSITTYAWLTWWIGDAAGAVIAAPLILAWFQEYPFRKNSLRILEPAVLWGTMLLLCYFVFFRNVPFEYGLMPLLLWAAFRFDMRGATTAAAVVAVFATIGTAHGSSPFSPFEKGTINESLLLLESFLGVTVICTLVLAGVLVERRQAGEALEESEAHFRLLVESAPEAIFVQSQGRFVYVNAPMLRLLGARSSQELLGTDFMKHVAPEFHEVVRERIHLQRETGKPAPPGDLEYIRMDGTRVSVETTAVAIRYQGNDAHLVFVRDITERKQAEEALRASHHLLESTLASLRDAVFIVDAKTVMIMDCNPAATDIFGYSREEILGRTTTFLHTDQAALDEFRKHLSTTMADKGFLFLSEFRMKRKDGTVFSTEHTVIPLKDEQGMQIGWMSVVRDITERKRVEETLRESEELNKAVLMHSPIGVSVRSPLGRLLLANDAYIKIWALTDEEVYEDQNREREALVFDETDSYLQPYFSAVREIYEHGYLHLPELNSAHIRPGAALWVAQHFYGLEDEHGQVERLVVLTEDITERKQAELALQRSEDLHRRVIDAAGAVPYIIRHAAHSFTYAFIGEKILQMTGYAASEMTSDIWNSLIQEGFPRGKLAHLTFEEADRLTDDDHSLLWECDFRIRTRDGQTRWIADTSVKGFDEKDESLISIGIYQDITERKRVEEEVKQLNLELEQRVQARTAELESANKELEAFSYSVSHDLRAPLRAINGFSQILSEDFSAEFSPPARSFLQKVLDSGLKMGQLIDGLLDFSKIGRKPLVLQDVEPASIVRAVIDALPPETSDRQIEWILPDLPPAKADPLLLQQVYANLIGNAVKYTGQRAVARIEIGSVNQAGKTVYFVRDNGAGFDMQYADKLFGVFQRLHSDSEFEGTGIGLATVQRIIHRHGGRIWAEAELEKGATFYFTL